MVRELVAFGCVLVVVALVLVYLRGSERRKFEAALAKEPCDLQSAHDLGRYLLESKLPNEVIELSDRFTAKCGALADLRLLKVEAARSISKWDIAEKELSALLVEEPSSYRYWGRRGLVYEQSGQLEKAEADFRQALLLNPELLDLPINLANLLERKGRFCDSVPVLQTALQNNPDAANANQIQSRIDWLKKRGSCLRAER